MDFDEIKFDWEPMGITDSLELFRKIKFKNKHFTEWTSDQCVDWICNLNDGKYSKYDQILRPIFKKEGVNGSALKFIDKQELRGWGIESFMDRKNIEQQIKKLVKNQGSFTIQNLTAIKWQIE